MKEVLVCPKVQPNCDTTQRFLFCSPYSSADLSLMASAFNMDISHLESELMNLILEGQIQARIDSHNKVILRRIAMLK